MSDGEPSLDPSYLLKAVRSFLAGAAQPAAGEEEAELPGAAGEPGGEDGLGWEEAGCLVWDSAALPDDASFLVKHDLPAMLPPLLTAAAASERWRALEIALGTLGNLACHAGTKQLLLGQDGLPQLLLDTILWVDDSASLAELCRCLTSLLADSSRQAAEAWWALLLREETLGRLVWIVENTLSPPLLERSLNLICCLVATAAAAGNSGATSRQLVPLLLSLDLLPLLASVLHGWVVRLRAEHQQFGGSGSTEAEPRSAEGAQKPAAAKAAAPAAGTPAAAEAGGGQEDPPSAAIAPPAPDSPAQWEERAVAAAEVTQEAAMEALGLLEALQADTAGEAAINASTPVKEALLRVVSESDSRSMRALATALLAAADDVGPLLVQHPRALAAVLDRLEAAAAEAEEGQPAKRARTEASDAEASSAEKQAGEEVEAAWALCSELARCLAQPQPAAGEGEDAGAAAEGVAPSGGTEAVLAVLAEHTGMLGRDWGDDDPSLAAHQAYVLGRVLPLLARRLGEAAAAELGAAAERAQATAAAAQQ
ncbi:saal1 isoform X1 [Chlorella sorokiniana]|uniref:Saal1 isoform X1 n=1 Tax=Chlorella sorokiniana TaxID=3076 RepID=A0A2P6TW47_CHLSO|nr:saal1 isoform X1 [Chlorella sorokiniana]|eukprot:PRW58285.1 saal1 isoform X1 [Chlorella sorokiniana]